MNNEKKGTISVVIIGVICLSLIISLVAMYITNNSPNINKEKATVENKDVNDTGEMSDVIVEENVVLVSDTVISIKTESSQTDEAAFSGLENTDYILLDSNSRYLEESDLENLTPEELSLARNEIYARHGRMFQDESIQSYFDSKEWYEPLYEAEEFDSMGDTLFNDYEIKNAQFISDYENQ